MTDSLTMAAVRVRYGDERAPVLALKAGADILADPPHLPTAYRAVLKAVQDGRVSEVRIDQSVERILRLKERLGLLDDPMVDADVVAEVLGTPRPTGPWPRPPAWPRSRCCGERTGWLPLPRRWTVQLTGWNDAGVRTLERELRTLGRTVETRWTGERPTQRADQGRRPRHARPRRHGRRHRLSRCLPAAARAGRRVLRLERAGHHRQCPLTVRREVVPRRRRAHRQLRLGPGVDACPGTASSMARSARPAPRRCASPTPAGRARPCSPSEPARRGESSDAGPLPVERWLGALDPSGRTATSDHRGHRGQRPLPS